MSAKLLLLPILLPVLAGLLVLVLPEKPRGLKEVLAVAVTAFNLFWALLFFKQALFFTLPWCGFGIDFSLRLFNFSAFILLAMAGFGLMLALYSSAFMYGKGALNQFYAYFLLTLGLANGAVLADNLILLLFFWEGLLLTLFGMIIIGRKEAFATAIKAFIIVGIMDLCLMLGIALTGHLAGTYSMAGISLPLEGAAVAAYLLLMSGAVAKAGSMPFHSWIPDAALDAPLPFMALVPAAIEKLLGIYLLARISLHLFILRPDSWVSLVLMILGACTILLAFIIALVQKDYKRLLSYHAISQVGYMILGIGTAVPVGIAGGIFHMLNHALYKSCLFLSGGSVEKQAGTTDLSKLGGLAKKMPVTFTCFLVAAFSISGVPPFNGFFSKELVYDGALQRGVIFYLAAILGSFLTAASFLKLGHAAYFGKAAPEHEKVKEASWLMLLPMLMIAGVCVFFGLYHMLPLQKFILPVLGEHAAFEQIGAINFVLVIITLVVLLGAVLNHLYGAKKTGSGLKSLDHIHYAPGLKNIYAKAQERYFDPYERGIKLADYFSHWLFCLDRLIDWFYEVFIVRITYVFSWLVRFVHSGNFSFYIVWALLGTAIIIVSVVK